MKTKGKKILFLCRLFYPHVGGVEKQVLELSKRLVRRGYVVTVITENYADGLKKNETVEGINIIRFTPLKIKYLGLFSIWWWFFKNRKFIQDADVVHAHSVYIWYWPFRLLYLTKPSFATFHGWEGIYPIPLKNILIRKIDSTLANKNISISDYLERHYHMKADKLMYTSVDLLTHNFRKIKKNYKSILYVGRLDKDTGLDKILRALSLVKSSRLKIDFCGDGPLKNKCKEFGNVHGFVDPNPFYKKAFICISPGVTSILEAFTYKCLIITSYNNPVKKDYLQMTPFKNWIIVEKSSKKLAEKIDYFINRPKEAESYVESAYQWVKTQNWNKALTTYLELWGYK